MTVAVYVLAGFGAITVLAALALVGAGWREASIGRHVDALAATKPARVYDWECEPESGCPDCAPSLDPYDVDLWIAQLRGPQANDQIARELDG